MLSLYQRIKEKRESLGMSQDELAHRLGYTSRSTVSKIESGKVDLSQSRIKAFADALNTTPAYLMGWEDEEERQDDNQIPPGCMPLPKTKKVPLYGNIACGEPILQDDCIEEYVDCPLDICADFCLRCKGDSMSPTLEDGDIVYFRNQSVVNYNGQIAAVRIDGCDFEVTLKRVYRKGDTLTLMPDNPKHSPKVFVREEMNNVHIEGILLGYTRRM